MRPRRTGERQSPDVTVSSQGARLQGALLSGSGPEAGASCVQEAHQFALRHGLADMAGYVERLLTDLAP